MDLFLVMSLGTLSYSILHVYSPLTKLACNLVLHALENAHCISSCDKCQDTQRETSREVHCLLKERKINIKPLYHHYNPSLAIQCPMER